MSFLSKLFGGGSKQPAANTAIEYNGFSIQPTPMKDGGHYRICAVVTKTIDGTEKSHTLIRADTLGSEDAANDASITKAKTMIDQVGDGIFR